MKTLCRCAPRATGCIVERAGLIILRRLKRKPPGRPPLRFFWAHLTQKSVSEHAGEVVCLPGAENASG